MNWGFACGKRIATEARRHGKIRGNSCNPWRKIIAATQQGLATDCTDLHRLYKKYFRLKLIPAATAISAGKKK